MFPPNFEHFGLALHSELGRVKMSSFLIEPPSDSPRVTLMYSTFSTDEKISINQTTARHFSINTHRYLLFIVEALLPKLFCATSKNTARLVGRSQAMTEQKSHVSMIASPQCIFCINVLLKITRSLEATKQYDIHCSSVTMSLQL